MATIKYKELRKRYELDGAEKTVRHLSEAIQSKELRPEDFSLRDLAEGLIPDGHLWVRELDPRSGRDASAVTEALDGVDVTAFSNITGKIISARIMESYEQETFALSKLIDTIPSRFETERIAGITPIVGDALEVAPGMPYPNLGFSEDYIDTPRTTKRGLIVSVTKEAIFFDRTHMILSRAAEVGEILGLNKEKRIIGTVLGLGQKYNWKGRPLDVYYPASATSPPWVNVVDDNELVDWRNVDKVEDLFGSMTDPTTKEPILIDASTVLIMPQKKQTAAQVFQPHSVMYATPDQTVMGTFRNPYARHNVVASRLAYQELLKANVPAAKASLYWFMGDFRKAFGYMENWPITVTQSPFQSEADFSQDIVVRFKASERGAVTVLDPRYIVQSIVP